MTTLSVVGLMVFMIPTSYWLLLAVASVKRSRRPSSASASLRFALCIPAHDEEAVISRSVEALTHLDYPRDLYTVHVVADHCSDGTARAARQSGAVVHERSDGPRTGKGAALAWLLGRIEPSDAIVIFDADTLVDPHFLTAMAERLSSGESVVQGRHVISNPEDGWYPALAAALFAIDNRFQNQGRVNLGLSAKNMGDSICMRADLLHRMGWADSLTDDHATRHALLLDGKTIAYEPAAVGAGEAPSSFAAARAQRSRWLRGTAEANEQSRRTLFGEALRRRERALLDAACQTVVPSYSTLALLATLSLVLQVSIVATGFEIAAGALLAWGVAVAVLVLYPIFGLALEKAPLRAYLAICAGPVFIVWRSWLALRSRFDKSPEHWKRTAHGVRA